MAIIGNIKKIEQHLADKNLQLVFDYFTQVLDQTSITHKRIINLPEGSFEKLPLSQDIFALEQVFHTKKRENCFFESHKKYIDFQLILNGVEQMEHIDIDKLLIDKIYDHRKDLITYQLVNNASKIVMQKGDLSIFFPDDAHMGQAMFMESELVYKTVIKLPIEIFEKNEN